MSKWKIYYTLIISAFFTVMGIGMFKEALKSKGQNDIKVFILIIPLFVLSAIYIYNIKKMKYKVENIYFLDNTIYIKTSIIGLILLTANYLTGQIYSVIKLSKIGFSTSPLFYIMFIAFGLFILFLIQLFIKIKNQSSKEDNTNTSLNVDEINIKQFSNLGKVSKKIDHSYFVEKKELDIDRIAYDNYKPILFNKRYNNDGNLLLNYINNDDLNFTLFIKNDSSIFIRHNNKKKLTDIINKEVLKAINS